MTNLRTDNTPLAVDVEIGGDAFMPGTSNPVTAAEIKDIYTDPTRAAAERKQTLTALRREMVSRKTTDEMDDPEAIIAEIDRGLDLLSKPQAGSADPAALRQRDVAVDPENL
jgi:hypothetical protein